MSLMIVRTYVILCDACRAVVDLTDAPRYVNRGSASSIRRWLRESAGWRRKAYRDHCRKCTVQLTHMKGDE